VCVGGGVCVSGYGGVRASVRLHVRVGHKNTIVPLIQTVLEVIFFVKGYTHQGHFEGFFKGPRPF
jgi:hypothetical protein